MKSFYNRRVHRGHYRETTQYPSKPDTGHSTTRSEPLQYTGHIVIGIATMHKSNAVPVTSKTAAKDLAKMRRN